MSEFIPPICLHCGEPLRERFCPDCDGGHIGWRYSSDSGDWEWHTCPTCGDTGIVRVCGNLLCSGQTVYTLSAYDAAMLRMVARKINEE